MKKAGIVTMAFHSKNYGGILQAYALARCLKKYGCQSEIIRYDYSSGKKPPSLLERWRKASLPEKVSKILRKLKAVPSTCAIKIGNRLYRHSFSERDKAFADFHREYMPYSETIYSWETIGGCVPDYDLFIAGSDQVWNQGWINGVFLLDFVPSDKGKLSYAASIAQEEITESQRDMLRASLKSFKAVSVREEKAAEQLAALGIASVPVLDPTLLLTREEWDELCSPVVIGGGYVFCYFLGSHPVMRKAAFQFAKRRRLKIVTLPHLLGNVRLCDCGFGGVKLYNVSPADFLSLIKHAAYVFTDSFHGCVFSFIYHKPFFAFDRIDACSFGMTSRMDSLMRIFDTAPRFCDTKDRTGLRYIESIADTGYSNEPERLLEMRRISMRFLEDNLR